jgi:spore germination cell wall hydrolase CwlJ-like protein
VGFAPFGLAALMLIAVPINAGHREPGTIARAAEQAPRIRQAMIASPFGTIHAATFSFPQPVGTAIPQAPVRLASLDINDLDVTAALGPGIARSQRPASSAAREPLPTVDRTHKGDFLAALPRADEPMELDLSPAPPPLSTTDEDIEAAVRFEPFPEYDISLSLELHPRVPNDEPAAAEAQAPQPDISLLALANDPDPSTQMSRVFFGDMAGSNAAGSSPALVPWNAGEEPVVMLPRAPDAEAGGAVVASLPDAAASPDTAAAPETGAAPDAASARPGAADDEARGGETVAGKGVVTGDLHVPNSPAERLALKGKGRDKAEKCLANAVYFESRGESVRGQIAVAQVVLNRTFSGYYPDNVCGVVYQNARRHNACQFTFACDGIPDVVTEPEAWDRAARIAKAMLDGKVWLPEIGKATHYHAYWVRPDWIREMRKLTRIGVHSFYRPRNWGDGDDAPSWGNTAATVEAAAQL